MKQISQEQHLKEKQDSLAKFEKAIFDDAEFKGEANFVDAQFSKEASFSKASFQDANFAGTRFDN